MLLLSCLLPLLWAPLLVASIPCSIGGVRFHKTAGVDCVGSNYSRIIAGVCSPEQCSFYCAPVSNCQAFAMLTNDNCQCKLFLFDACSHRVQSEPNCTRQITVYVRSMAGVPPGRLCPDGYIHTKYGTSYKVVTNTLVTSYIANQTCSAEPGLSKYADAIDNEEAMYLRSLKQLTGLSNDFYVGGFLRSGLDALIKSNWYWAACNVTIDANSWYPTEPNGGSTGCTNLYNYHSNGGIDDDPCNRNQPYI